MNNDSQPPANKRILSIDALRGFDMLWIIGGGIIGRALPGAWDHPVTQTIATQMEHVEWEGFRFEDLIFPLFIFIVGTVLPFAIARREARQKSLTQIHFHIIKRTAVLILMGLIMNGLMQFDWPNMRWPGVLQRIGLCYGFAALLVAHTKWPTQALIAAAILLIYWALTMYIPAPGFEPGDLTPKGCLASYIDQQLLPGQLYYGYGDNEGLFSTLPAIATALIGALTGHWLRTNRSENKKTIGLAVAGLAALIVGYVWGQYFPIIKTLWTSSYVLVAAGYSLILLALFYWLIDVKGFRRWPFVFVVIGTNALTIYFLQSFVKFNDIAAFFLTGIANHAGFLAPIIIPLGILATKWLLLLLLYRRKIFVKI